MQKIHSPQARKQVKRNVQGADQKDKSGEPFFAVVNKKDICRKQENPVKIAKNKLRYPCQVKTQDMVKQFEEHFVSRALPRLSLVGYSKNKQKTIFKYNYLTKIS